METCGDDFKSGCRYDLIFLKVCSKYFVGRQLYFLDNSFDLTVEVFLMAAIYSKDLSELSK